MRRQRDLKRSGMILIVVLVCMGVATTLVLGAVQSSLRQRRHLRQEFKMEQTKWLLDAGIRRAVFQLAGEEKYDGESIVVTPGLPKYPYATLEIKVNRVGQPEHRVRLRVTARLGESDDPSAVIQRSRDLVVGESKRD